VGLFNIFAKKRYNNAFEKQETQADALIRSIEVRKNDAELRRLRHELKVAQQRTEIEEAKQYLNEMRGMDDGEDAHTSGIEEKLLEMILLKVLAPQNQQPAASQNIPQTPDSDAITLTDDEIRATISEVPKHYLKLAKGMPDEQLKQIVKQRGNFSEDTLNRALHIIRNEKI